ncbi:MAG TPA: hypothetical protein VFK27_03800, partial [Bacillales bacterium]|nr:hypothetical protein [Bacillales bacterium]
MGNLTYKGKHYQLTFAEDRPFVNVEDDKGNTLAELFVLSSVHTLGAQDDTTKIGSWQAEDGAGGKVFSLKTESSVWDDKIYRFKCTEDRFVYEMEVEGSGKLADVQYFGGY